MTTINYHIFRRTTTAGEQNMLWSSAIQYLTIYFIDTSKYSCD